MSEPFSKSMQKRIEAQTGEKLFTKSELQTRLAVALRGAANAARRGVAAIILSLHPDWEKALAEHDAALREQAIMAERKRIYEDPGTTLMGCNLIDLQRALSWCAQNNVKQILESYGKLEAENATMQRIIDIHRKRIGELEGSEKSLAAKHAALREALRETVDSLTELFSVESHLDRRA